MIYFSNKMPDCHAFYLREDEPIPEEFVLHTHYVRIEIFCLVSGRVTYYVEGNTYTAHPGDLMMSIPGETHRVEVSPDMPYERMVIIFEPKMLSGIDPEGKLTAPLLRKQIGERNLFRAEEAGSIPWTERMGQIMQEAPEPRLHTIAALTLLLQQMLTAISQDRGKPALTQQEHHILQYINANISQPLSLEHLCSHFYLSRANLCRMFRNSTGTTVGKYVTTKRMLLARQLICQGSKPSQIFAQCGYRDYSSFFRAYCKFHAHPPKSDMTSVSSPAEDDTVSLK